MSEGPALAVPSPSLVLMVGPAGSGKTTFCRRNFPASSVISSDDCRAAVAGDPADQSATPAAFSPRITTCASVPAMRVWTSLSKPFITAITVSSDVTPTATPPIEIPVRSEMNPD